MRTNIVLNDDLVAEAAKLTGIHTKRALVDEALRTLVTLRKRQSLMDIKGRISFAPDYDYKAARAGES